MTWLLVLTVVTLNGSIYVAVPFADYAACMKAGQGRVAAIYHPDAGEGADAYKVEDAFFKCERREDMAKRSTAPARR